MKKILVILLAIFSFNNVVNAASACSYQEQNEIQKIASNVKMSYEIKEEVMDDSGEQPWIEYYFSLSILNVTEDIYVIVKNDQTDEIKTIKYSDTDNGIYNFRWDNFENVTNFTIEVYSTNKTSCPDEKYKTLYYSTPRYNDYSRRTVCSSIPDFYLCQEFVSFSEIPESTFLKKINDYLEGTVNKEGNEIPTTPKENGFIKFVRNYGWILGVCVIIIGGAGTAIIIKVNKNKKKQRDLGL